MSSEGNFQAEMSGRVAEIKAAMSQIEDKTFTEIGSAGFEFLYVRMLSCQLRFECAAQEFIYSGEHYAERGKLAGEDAEVMHAHYLFQRKRESSITGPMIAPS
jgi:hypothetical protein